MKKIKPLFKLLTNHSLFCQHDYKIINQFEMLSEFDIVVLNGKTPNTWNNIQRRMVTDFKCEKCNKLKRLQTTTAPY